MDERKDEGVYKSRKITPHSFKRFVRTVISERCELYATKCMKYLTFLDYINILTLHNSSQ